MEPLDISPRCAFDIVPLDMAPDAFGLELPADCAKLAPARAALKIKTPVVMPA
jgi:hypothetical protein